MAKRILITGAAGFFATHLCNFICDLDKDLVLICTDMFKPQTTACNKFIIADLTCVKAVEKLIKQTRPDYIIHLAGTFGTKDPHEIFRVNVLSMAALLEAARKHAPDVIMIGSGSAAEYGRIGADQMPVNEQTVCEAVTPYGLSKQLATQIALYYFRVHNVCTMIIRPFQLIGNGITSRLVPGAFAKQLKKTIGEGKDVIKVGNLHSVRDFLDIHDAVEAVWKLCQKPIGGEVFNLCSGKPTKIADLLKTMIDYCGVDVKIEVDQYLLRKSNDVSSIYGTYKKLNDHCGWQPKRTLNESVKAIFNSKIY